MIKKEILYEIKNQEHLEFEKKKYQKLEFEKENEIILKRIKKIEIENQRLICESQVKNAKLVELQIEVKERKRMLQEKTEMVHKLQND
jgi:hypothetical protein